MSIKYNVPDEMKEEIELLLQSDLTIPQIQEVLNKMVEDSLISQEECDQCIAAASEARATQESANNIQQDTQSSPSWFIDTGENNTPTTKEPFWARLTTWFVISGILAVCALIGMFSASSASNKAEEQQATYQDYIDRQNDSISTYKSQLEDYDSLKSSVSDLQADKTSLQKQYDDLSAVHANCQSTIDSLNAQIADLNAQIEALKNEATGLRTQITQLQAPPPSQTATQSSNISASSSSDDDSSSGGGTVYWTPNGEVYHSTKSCPSLKRSKTIISGSIAESHKSRGCKNCY